MRPASLSGIVDVGMDILSTAVNKSTRKILAQIGNALTGSVESDGVELVQHVGIASRPVKALPGKAAAQCVRVQTSDRDVIIGSVDLRGLELYGELEDGETCVYAAGADGKGQARALFKGDGSVHLYTRKGNTPDGTGMTFQLDAQAGALRMLNDRGFAIIIDQDGIVLTAGKASLRLDKGGDISLVGTGKTQVDGSSIVVGSMVAPVVNAALTGPTGVAGKASLKTLIE